MVRGGNVARSLAAALLYCAAWSAPGLAGSLYDMNGLLREPYPLAPAAARPAPHPLAAAAKPAAPPAEIVAPAPPPAQKFTWKDVFSEVRLGVLAHDQGPFSSHKEDGADINLEVLFQSPEFLDIILSPRPHVGATLDSETDTNQAYLGLTWEWGFLKNAFFDFSFGGAYHDGIENGSGEPNRKELGCNVLFRLAGDLGWRFGEHHSLMMHYSHISNADLCDSNEGLENVGLRYGYRF